MTGAETPAEDSWWWRVGEVVGVVILLSFGIKTLSMSEVFIPRARNIIRKIKISDLEEIKNKVLDMENSIEIKKYIRNYIKNL